MINSSNEIKLIDFGWAVKENDNIEYWRVSAGNYD